MTYVQEGKYTVTPADSPFTNLFKKKTVDNLNDLVTINPSDNKAEWTSVKNWTPYHTSTSGEFSSYLFNQKPMVEFYNNLQQSGLYKGMYEAIGRTTIYATRTMDVDFMRFLQPPLEYGRAIMEGIFTDLTSHPWQKYEPEGSESKRPMMFNTDVPEMHSSVAECMFSREIRTKINEREYTQFSQTGQMVGQVGGVLMGKINAAYLRDLYEASKEYFCGILRITPEPEGTAGTTPMTRESLRNNKMVEFIEHSKSEGANCIAEALHEVIHQTVNKDFHFMSKKFNPDKTETRTTQMTLIMDKEYMYPMVQKFYADTFHPEYVKFGGDTKVSMLWIDDYPEHSKAIYPAGYKLIGMIVDDECPKITPLNSGLTLQSFYNGQEESTSFYAHYEMIFSFSPWFNRKYIFVKTDENTNDNVTKTRKAK